MMDASSLARADARWQEILDERPDLGPALTLQRSLVSRLIRALDELDGPSNPAVELPSWYLALKLARGVPLLIGERPPLPVGQLAPLLLDFAADLAEGGAGAAAARIGAAIESGRIDAGSLLAASLARDQPAVRVTSNQLGLAPDLLWLIAELAVSPFAHRAARSLSETLRSSAPGWKGFVTEEPHPWNRGYCPVCGSWPVLASLPSRGRLLGCSFCASAWQPEHRCTYCAEAGASFTVGAPDPERRHRMIEMCGTCGGYLKAIRLDAPAGFPLLAIEDLATSDLDYAALERGYSRPPMPSRYPA